MTVHSAEERTTLFAREEERRQAHALLEEVGHDFEGMTLEGVDRTTAVPRELATIMGRILEVMANGGSVVVGSLPEELTTTVAAEQLGVSRPTLMKLIRDGELQAHKVGSHNRVKTADVLAFRRERLRRQRVALDELRALEDELDDR